jgi:hypothetical protein
VLTKTELVARISRELRVHPSTVYRRIDKGQLSLDDYSHLLAPPEPAKTGNIINLPISRSRANAKPAAREISQPRRKPARASWLAKNWPGPLAAMLAVLGAGLGIATLGINFYNGLTTGEAITVASGISACFGAVCDGLTIFVPIAAARFIQERKWFSFMVAATLTIGCGTYSAINCSSFASRTFGDAAAGRESIKKAATLTEEQRQRGIEIAQQKVSAATDDKARDCRRGRHFDRDECDKAAKALGDATQALAVANAVQVMAAPAVSDPDPGPHQLGQLLHAIGGTEHRVKLVRMLIWTLAPVFAGALLFLVPMAARRRERP